MRFTSLALIIATTAVAVAAGSSLLESCGPDAQIIQQRTLYTTAKGSDITMTVTSCPGFAALRNRTTASTSTVRKRQVVQQSTTCASISCLSDASQQPAFEDCEDLSDNLINISETFVINPATFMQFSDGNCFYRYGNLDRVSYEVLTPPLGQAMFSAVEACTAQSATTAAVCNSPGVANDDWMIESGFI